MRHHSDTRAQTFRLYQQSQPAKLQQNRIPLVSADFVSLKNFFFKLRTLVENHIKTYRDRYTLKQREHGRVSLLFVLVSVVNSEDAFLTCADVFSGLL